MQLRFAPAVDLPYPALAQLFERAFAAYLVPVHATTAQLEARNRLEHVDLCASLLVLAGDDPVGLALIARRGRRSRVAAMGVCEPARGTGAGRALLGAVIEAARARGDHELVLECIAANHRALRLYEAAGFAVRRRLVGWRGGGLVPAPAPLIEVGPDQLGRALARADDGSLPWQLAPETLVALTAPARGFTLDGDASIVVTPTASELAIRAVFTPPAHRRRGHAARLVRAVAAAFALPIVVTPIVPEDVGGELARALGLVPHELSQLELRLALG